MSRGTALAIIGGGGVGDINCATGLSTGREEVLGALCHVHTLGVKYMCSLRDHRSRITATMGVCRPSWVAGNIS